MFIKDKASFHSSQFKGNKSSLIGQPKFNDVTQVMADSIIVFHFPKLNRLLFLDRVFSPKKKEKSWKGNSPGPKPGTDFILRWWMLYIFISMEFFFIHVS
jgi:hypothetical protein